jgi:DNA-binding protein H-NS
MSLFNVYSLVGTKSKHGAQAIITSPRRMEMAKYRELQEKIAELQHAAEKARTEEIGEALQKIRSLMQEYGLTPADLQKTARKKPGKSEKGSDIQFQDGSGNTWSGRGRMPGWLKGKDKEQFRVS